MANMTIRNFEDDIKQGLRVRAARHGVSMEQEARSILREVISKDISFDEAGPAQESAWDMVKRLREKYGTFDMDVPQRADVAASRSIFDD